MAKQDLNLGTVANDHTGDSIRVAGGKINNNFAELYAALGNGSVLTVSDVTKTGSYDDLSNKPVIPFLSAVDQHIIPDTDITYDLGSGTRRFRDLYLSGNTIDLGGVSISSAPDGSLILPGTTIAVWEPSSIVYWDNPNGIPLSESFGSDVPVIIDQVTYYLCRPENASERTGATPAAYQPVLDGNGVITSINIITPGAYPTVGDLWQDVNQDSMWALPPGVDIGDWDDIYAAVDNIEINGNDPYGAIVGAGVESSIVGSRTATTGNYVAIASTAPSTSVGASGDLQGMVAFDGTYMYYCTANYDGSTNIWKRVAWSNDTW
jgi:hypothetical protein